MAGDNKKNSFRDMMLIIFVVLICFGITIYGIVYLTGKVFSGAGDISETSGERPVTAMTDPESGDTLTFTPIGEPADEIKPVVSGNTVSENTDTAAFPKPAEDTFRAPVPPVETQAPAPAPALVKKAETVKPADNIRKEAPKEAAPAPAAAPKPQEPKPAAAPAAAPKKEGAFVVQIAALQSKESAEKEARKYKTKYPDVFIKQVVIDGKTWYRVRLGVSAAKEEAQRIADRVAADFKIKPMVTKNN